MTGKIQIREDGDANVYTLLDDKRWLASVRLNGEFLVERQREMMVNMALGLQEGKLVPETVVKGMLDKSMKAFQAEFVKLVRECALHRDYRDLTGREALNAAADRMEKLS